MRRLSPAAPCASCGQGLSRDGPTVNRAVPYAPPSMAALLQFRERKEVRTWATYSRGCSGFP